MELRAHGIVGSEKVAFHTGKGIHHGGTEALREEGVLRESGTEALRVSTPDSHNGVRGVRGGRSI
jgi:hypothetical protein